MDLTATSYKDYARPSGALKDISALFSRSGQWKLGQGQEDNETESWETSTLNPKNRIDSLTMPLKSFWRVDTLFDEGLRASIVPSALAHWPPLRIEALLPDQSLHPRQLRAALQSHRSFHVDDARSPNLGICIHLVRTLNAWTSSFQDPYKFLRRLSFGSTIVIHEVRARIFETDISVQSSNFAKYALTLEELQMMWKFPTHLLPKVLRLRDLELVHHINDKVSIVRHTGKPSQYSVLKSSTDSLRYVYHELKNLLSMIPHPNIIGRPKAIVSVKDDSGRDVVIGFLLELHQDGALSTVLPLPLHHTERNRTSDHELERIRWAIHVTEALIHIRNECKMFYTDLKTENVLLKRQKNGNRDVVLIDFEQAGAANAWTAPEVIYIERLRSILNVVKDKDDKKRYETFCYALTGRQFTSAPKLYNNPPHGYNLPWSSMSAEEQESAEVFALGKLVFCIFEGTSSATVLIQPSSPHEPDPEFPFFIRTPLRLRRLIEKCTLGAREYNQSKPFLVRRGDKLYPRGKTGQSGEPLGTAEDVKKFSRLMWIQELQDLEKFCEAKIRYKQDCADTMDMSILHYLRRPSLSYVLQELKGYEHELSILVS